jgi:hypothetical protein
MKSPYYRRLSMGKFPAAYKGGLKVWTPLSTEKTVEE